ncbi:MAG: NlpC/P60 family protein [Chthoniobacterales bacterium]
MRRSRLTRWLSASLALLIFCPETGARAEEPSLGKKIKRIFATPTPTPARRRAKKAVKKKTPMPSPSPTPKRKAKSSPSPEEEATPNPKKKKKKTSPTPSPSPSPSASPSTTPSPSPEESPPPTPEESTTPSPTPSPTPRVATVTSDEIVGFDKNPESVRKLLTSALELTKRNLEYKYGSADPAEGGMDCSGFIYFVLRENGVKDVPRDASGQYVWVRKAGNFRAVLSRELDSFELDELAPGDLLFWTGTYKVERDPPVTHTMIYLGKQKDSDKPIMVGASDGRTYEGEQQFGVSVFDFKTVRSNQATTSGTHPRFVGYAKIPGLGETTP